MKFLVNPRTRTRARTRMIRNKPAKNKRKRVTLRRGPGGQFLTRKSPTRKGATMARRKGRTRRTVRRGRMRRNPSGKFIKSVKRRGKKVTRRSWARSGFKRNPRRGRRRASSTIRRSSRRRSYRRNPGFLATLMRGLKDAALVTVGKVGYNLIARQVVDKLPLPIPGVAGDAIKGLVVVGIGSFGVSKVLSGDTARFLIAGMCAGLLEGLARATNVPVISGALGEYDTPTGTMDSMGVYPALAAYPSSMGNYATTEDQIETQSAYGM